MSKTEAGTSSRGDQRAPLRPLLARAGLLSPGAMAALPGHDIAWGRPWLAPAPGRRAGDLRREARGLLEGALWSHGQRRRRVEVRRPLKATRRATQAALHLAEVAGQWDPPPARAAQRLAWGHGLEQRGTEGAGPLHACGRRGWKSTKKRTASLVVGTTEQRVSAPWLGRQDEERPEMAPDEEPRKRGGWQRHKRSATRSSALVFSGLTGGLSSRRYPLLTKTPAGTRFAAKTRPAIAFEPLRPPRTPTDRVRGRLL